VLTVVVVVALLLSGGGSAHAPRRAALAARAVSRHVAKTTPSTQARARKQAPSPGTLPQTTVRPPASGAVFVAEMRGLWKAVISDQLTPALPAFFPQAAYVQLKQIPNPGGDWTNRLISNYRLDISAAHALLGAGAHRARLLSVSVPENYAHWIRPGICANGIGYYEVPNSRVVYREDGQTRSFGIASMISWRGVWYVVHFGAILRSTATTGQVYEPAVGPGVSEYSGTC
jgi:hypothetical protein